MHPHLGGRIPTSPTLNHPAPEGWSTNHYCVSGTLQGDKNRDKNVKCVLRAVLHQGTCEIEYRSSIAAEKWDGCLWRVQEVSHGGKREGETIVWEVAPWTSPGVTLRYTATPPLGGDDARIIALGPDRNTAGSRMLEEGGWTGQERSDHKKILIRFDLSPVPATYAPARAELRLFAFNERLDGLQTSHTLYAAPGLTDIADAESSTTASPDGPEWIAFDVTESVRRFLRDPSLNHGWKISQDPVRGVDDEEIQYVNGIFAYKSREAPEVPLRPMQILIPSELTAATTAADGP